MNKKVKIGINIFLVILVGIIAFLIISQFLKEHQLRNEINEVYSLIYAEQYDFDAIYTNLNKIETDEGYAVVEGCAKDYLRDLFDKILDFTNILNDDETYSILTVENFKNDGPSFKESNEYLTKTKQNILNLEAEISSYLKEETIMAYIVNENLEDSYVNLYKSFDFAKEKEINKKKETIGESVDNFVALIEKEQEVLAFLTENKNNWYINNDTINFKNEDLSAKYNEMIAELNQ